MTRQWPRPPLGRHLLITLLLSFLAITANAYKPLSDSFFRAVPNPGQDIEVHNNAPNNGPLLWPLLIPRVPGTAGSHRVQRHFIDFFRNELPKWSIELHNSSSTTPATGTSVVPFTNLIFKREPPWTKPGQANLLTLVAHFDSKRLPEGFIGATDSAVPCAVLLHVARSVDKYLTQMHDEMVALGELGGSPAMDMGVQILLLDGEESFVAWTATDSIYGARALANDWEQEATMANANFPNRLNQISLFLLLDLLGSQGPKIPSYFLPTHWAYRAMATIEERMRDLGLLEAQHSQPWFTQKDKSDQNFGFSGIGDDHIPFMAKGVPVLHVIPSPFPDVWHMMTDDAEHLDMPTVRDWAKIVTAFALEWLDMMEVWPVEE